MSMAGEDDDAPGTGGGHAAGGGLLPSHLGGHFQLLQELGSGSSSTVYRARLTTEYDELPVGAEVAVKFLRKDLLADERARDRLLAEGTLGRTLRHPNLAAILGVETLEVLGLQVTYLVMELVLGTTLRDLVARSGPPVEDLVRRIGADAAGGLFALHRRGLVHRDVKPENLILTEAGALKIVDLGLVRPFDKDAVGRGSAGSGGSGGRSSAGLFGSVAYSAPEILRGQPASPRSDLYALGAVLYEVATGRHPFAHAQDADEMLHAHLHTAPPPPSHLRARISPLLEQLLQDLLQKDPGQRPRDAAEVQRILEQGEHSEYWRRHEARAPVLASQRRLLRMRRPAETPFFGRDEERRLCDEQFARAGDGRGSIVIVSGPDGSGRRRLCDEVMAGWLERADPPLCLGGEADTRFGHGEPFASAVSDLLLRGDDPSSPRSEERAIHAARDLLQLDEPAAAALVAVAFGRSTERAEVRADRLASALLSLPREGRVLVLRVDHADRLDTSGGLVLQRLVASRSGKHMLLLLVAGVDGIQIEHTRRLELAGLAEHEFLEFGRALFREPVADAFLLDAHQVLSGVPGNLLEALDHLQHEGKLRGRPGDYHDLEPGAEARPAPGHVARFQERVERFEPRQRAVLSAAAILGERCSLDDLAALVDAPQLTVLETLSLFRGRIVRAQGGEVSFRHPDFKRVLLRNLPAEERRQLHLRAAQLLERRGHGPLVVGMHRSMAQDHEGCLSPLLEALDDRVRAGSQRTTQRILGRLAVHFEHVPHDPAHDRLRLHYLLLSGRARGNLGQHEAAAKALRQAEAMAKSLGDVTTSALARTHLANGELDRGHLLAAQLLLEAVHDDLAQRHDAGADAAAAQAHGLHGRILLYLGQVVEGQRHLQAALLRLPAAAVDLRCHLHIDLARIQALGHHFTTATRTLQLVEREAQALRYPRVQMRLHLYRGQMRAALGDEDATQDLRLALDEARRLSLPSYGGRAALYLGERMFWRRRDDEARTLFELANELAVAGGDSLGEGMARTYLARLGAVDPDLAERIEALDLPSVRVNFLLAEHGESKVLPDAAVEALEALLEDADLALPLHLRVLARLDRPAMARSLVRAVAERLPNRGQRRRFLAEWGKGARI
ncbi:MAG: protein kinase [Planctomycetes bacterium]|nr:protein kinase [Planctomycetota bacterium]